MREKFSDEKLYALCKKFGKNALYYRRRFIGLLPEVYRRKLYEKKGFGSIFEFAARLCGVSEEHVRRVLNLERKFEDLPVLKNMLVTGVVSVNKLAKIASMANERNQEALAEQVKLLPCRALETLTKDERRFENQNGLQEPLFGEKSVHVSNKEPLLAEDVKQRLAELQEKRIDINEMLRGMLTRRERELREKKEDAGRDAVEAARKAAERAGMGSAVGSGAGRETGRASSRYISVKVRRILHEEYGDKCSMPFCARPARQIHHTQRFALAGSHDPRYLAPMCEEHHKIAHSIDLSVQRGAEKRMPQDLVRARTECGRRSWLKRIIPVQECKEASIVKFRTIRAAKEK